MGYEHSLMLDTTLIPAYLEKHTKVSMTHSEGFSTGLHFSEEPLDSEKSAKNVEIKLSETKTNKLTYDEETGNYLLYQYSAALTDSTDGSKVRFENAIVLYTAINGIKGDTLGHVTVKTTGSGNGYIIRDGVYLPIEWSRESTAVPFSFKYADGTDVTLGIGRTYIAIIPTANGKVTFE